MNFDKSLRAAMPAAEEPLGLQSAIDRQVAHYRTRHSVRRRVFISLAATAAAVAAFTLVPVLGAQASLQRMMGALDGVDSLICSRYTLDDQGNRKYSGSQIYDHGRWRLESNGNRDVTLFSKGKRYQFEPFTKSYIVKAADGPFENQPAIKLSSLLGQMGSWGNSVVLDETQFNGKTVTRAIITNRDLPERYILLADKSNSLPISGYVEGREGSRWRRTLEMDFDYSAKAAGAVFEPAPGVPQLSQEDWETKVSDTMLAQDLGRHPLKNGELVFRTFDVAADGSVFVAFQSNKRLGGWGGYALDLDDGMGGNYTQVQTGTSVESPFNRVRPKDGGRIELAVFIPLQPRPWQPHTYTVKAHLTDDGELVRPMPMTVQYPDGRKEIRQTPDPSTYRDLAVLSRRVKSPTCEERPDYMTIESFGEWQSRLTSQLCKAGLRSRHFGDTPEAAPWLREELRLMTKIEQEGGGPYSRGSIREKIAKAERGR
jgi:hypothetical protein